MSTERKGLSITGNTVLNFEEKLDSSVLNNTQATNIAVDHFNENYNGPSEGWACEEGSIEDSSKDEGSSDEVKSEILDVKIHDFINSTPKEIIEKFDISPGMSSKTVKRNIKKFDIIFMLCEGNSILFKDLVKTLKNDYGFSYSAIATAVSDTNLKAVKDSKATKREIKKIEKGFDDVPDEEIPDGVLN